MHESLRLSQVKLSVELVKDEATISPQSEATSTARTPQTVFHYSALQGKVEGEQQLASPASASVKTDAQQSQETFISSLDTAYVKDHANTAGSDVSPLESENESEADRGKGNPRHSVHLYSMRISHHLRSGSLLSWDALDVPELPNPPPHLRGRIVPETRLDGRSRHERQTSSSGFASSKVPSKWGKVLPPSREEMSSIYSSRPHSPPDSFGGSMGNLSLPVRHQDSHLDSSKVSAFNIVKYQDSVSTDDEITPRPHKHTDFVKGKEAKQPPITQRANGSSHPDLPRNNSVANTKKSKFREEFSPAPPRKRSTPTMSLMKILRPRVNLRSHSEANLKVEDASHAQDTSHAPVDQIDLDPGSHLALDGLTERGPFGNESSATRHDRTLSRSFTSMQKEQRAIGKEKEANPMWERALKSYQEERSSLFLPANKSLAAEARPFRERSGSFNTRAISSNSLSPVASKQVSERSQSRSSLRPPSADEPEAEPSYQPKLLKRRTALMHVDRTGGGADLELQAAFDRQKDDFETVGAWGRYPSHTRPERTSSASYSDSVRTRDFALETTIQFAKEEEEIDPVARPESPTSLGDKRKKKRTGSGRMAKSNSMTFGKTFLKNYTRIFKSQSTEFQRHGYGHRSSIAAGGNLEFPELELIPDVWAGRVEKRVGHRRSRDGTSDESSAEEATRTGLQGQQDTPHHQSSTSAHRELTSKAKGKQKVQDSPSTIRSTLAKDADLALDGIAEKDLQPDRARVWSTYYEDCVPAFPRPSTDYASLSQPNLNEMDEIKRLASLRNLLPGRPSNDGENTPRPTTGRRHSFDSKRGSLQSRHSRTLPGRLRSSGNSSRHASRFSHASIMSGVQSHVSEEGHGQEGRESRDGGEEKSIVSVRKSTLDLISLFREQEITERERVLGLMRRGSASVRCA